MTSTHIESPDAQAQALIEEAGGDVKQALRDLRQSSRLGFLPLRQAGFWRDVATLLRLETASDETEEQATARWVEEQNVAAFQHPSGEYGW